MRLFIKVSTEAPSMIQVKLESNPSLEEDRQANRNFNILCTNNIFPRKAAWL